MRKKLKNDYFSNLARNINTVVEARKIEEEFRLCQSYNHITHRRHLIASEKMTEFFKEKEKPVDWQPEVITPGFYSNVLPPGNININNDIPGTGIGNTLCSKTV